MLFKNQSKMAAVKMANKFFQTFEIVYEHTFCSVRKPQWAVLFGSEAYIKSKSGD